MSREKKREQQGEGAALSEAVRLLKELRRKGHQDYYTFRDA